MKWNLLQTYDDMLGLIRGFSTPDVWVCRCLHQIVAFSRQTHNPLWRLTEINEVVAWGDQSLLLVQGMGIASTFLDMYEPRCFLFGFEPASGEVTWQTRVHWTESNIGNHGGLSASDRLVFLTEVPVSTPQLVWLDPHSGERLHTCPSPDSLLAPVVSGDYVFVEGGWDGGLYRAPTEPGAGSLEGILEGQIKSIAAQDDHLFVLYTVGEWKNMRQFLVCYQADTLDILGKIELKVEKDYKYARLYNIGHPHRVLMYGDFHLLCLDTENKTILWDQTLPDDRYTDLAVTPWGALVPFGGETPAVLVDIETGQFQPMAEIDPPNRFIPVGELCFVNQDFSAGLYTTQPVGGEGTTIEVEEFPATDINTLVKNDAPLDPREALRDAFGAATRSEKLDPALEKIREVFPVRRISGKVKAFLKALMAKEIPEGPLNFSSWDTLASHCFRYSDLFSFGDKKRFFPAFLIASEFGGIDFYMMINSGKVIALHHDATFYEVASEVWEAVEENEASFEKAFPKTGALHTIDQLLAFQKAFAGVRKKDFGEIPPEELIPKIAAAFEWSVRELAKSLNHHAMEFLYWDIMDHQAILDSLISMEMENK